MLNIHPQYIKDTAGKNLVVIPQKEFDTMMEAMEDLEDIKKFDAVTKKKLVFVDADIAFRQIEAKRKKNV